jgi:predicted nucleic acid-binding protein
MILVDTSVLIDYFRGSSNSSTQRFEEVLAGGIPFGINHYIYQEVLQGSSTEKDFKRLREYLSTQRFYVLNRGMVSYESAARLYFLCRKKGITIRSTIDFLIAQTAIENNLVLMHNDEDFNTMAKVIKELKVY